MTLSKKIVLLGHFGVGKSSLVRRFVANEFSDDYKVTIGVNILKKQVDLDEDRMNLILWDVEGNDEMKNFRSSYLMGASAFIYVFDASRPITYQDLKINIDYLKEKYPEALIQIIGNKVDLVEQELIEERLKEKDIKQAYLSSAKTGQNVERVFHDLAIQLSPHA